MSVVPAVRCWWDAHVRPSGVWARLAAEADLEVANADHSTDHYLPHEIYAIACNLAGFAELLELRADLWIRKGPAT